MPRTRNESRRDEARRLLADGKTTREIADTLGVDRGTVSRWTRDIARPHGRRKREDVTDQEVIEGHEGGLSWAELAAATGMSVTGVRLRYAMATGQGRPDRPREGAGTASGTEEQEMTGKTWARADTAAARTARLDTINRAVALIDAAVASLDSGADTAHYGDRQY